MHDQRLHSLHVGGVSDCLLACCDAERSGCLHEVGDKGVLSISNALAGNTNLEKLGLNANQIGNVGARGLSEALPSTHAAYRMHAG